MKLTQDQIERVKALADAEGRIKPSSVVEDAKKKSSPLHSLFVWDARKAAEIHWQHVAREIIGAVEIVVTTTTATVDAPFFVRDPEAKGEGYRAVSALRGDPVNARESLIYTLEVAKGHLRRAHDLAAPLGLEADIDRLVAEVLGVQRLLKSAA